MQMTMRAVALAVLAHLVIGAPLGAAEVDVGALLREFRGEAEPIQRTPAEAEAAYAVAVASLLPDLGSDDLVVRTTAQNSLEAMTHLAGRPGNEAAATALSKAMAAKLGPDTPVPARVWMLRMLQHIGGAESVPAVTALLADSNAEVRESARRTLQKNPSDEAGTALRAALDGASDPAWRVALLNAVADRRDAAATAAFIKALGDANVDVATAGARALGRIGGPEAIRALAATRQTVAAPVRPVVADALLRCADALTAANRPSDAADLYTSIYQTETSMTLRTAALRGLFLSDATKAIACLTEILASDDTEMQIVAVDLARDMAGNDATKALADLLPKASTLGKIALLRALDLRGDAVAKPAVLEALRSDDADVRTAAATTLGSVGNASDIPTLAALAAGAPNGEKAAAAGALVCLGGEDVNAAIVANIQSADTPATQVALLKALAGRRASAVAPQVAAIAEDPDPNVQTEALATLGVIGSREMLPTLVALVTKVQDGSRQAAGKALLSVIGRTVEKDPQGCADAVLAGLASTPEPAAKAVLLRTLSRIGGAKAFEVVHSAAGNADETVKDAAIRSLAEWPDDRPLADLLAIAQTSSHSTHQVIALRGYVRLIGLSQRPVVEKVKMYQAAMAAAKRPADRKMVLAGLAETPCIETLAIAKTYLKDDTLKAEAVAAAVKIAVTIAGSDKEEARETLQSLVDHLQGDLRRQALNALNFIERDEGFITLWMVSGPYRADGVEAPALFDTVFEPEKGDGSKAKWKAVPPNEGVLDLGQLTEPGENCSAYLRTYILSAKAQTARLELGSDDSVKVWLNGEVVHANNCFRGYQPNQDVAKVTLRQGTNVLLVKVTNGGGSWGTGVRIRAEDGGKISGLRFRQTAE